MSYTVKQLSAMAGVTPRTLHYYDQIGLLRPSSVGDNGYRYYNDAAALRLQQIMFYRELGLSLDDIRAVLDSPEFDSLDALRQHREALRRRATRLNELIDTVDRTILHLRGKAEMSTNELFQGFDDETQARYEEEVMTLYDPQFVQESSRRWKGYSAEQKAGIIAEGQAVYVDMATLIGRRPDDPAVQAVVARWHAHMRRYYEPTPAILRGLARGYEEDPRFSTLYESIHPQLPGFLRAAIEHYVDQLTTDNGEI
ncbi:MAG: MerR family transcriptional regulator [Candidatus Promineofilum sp.]|nr:MerR family transcriptional regulator [Promineifilum sp.]